MFRLLPWKFIVQRAARAYGMGDPALWLARIRSFAQPSEVAEPIELLRAGVLFHARGIVNTKAIQHNLDWVWPYWAERQFDPEDVSFIPRAFSFSHVNLTHRNWTAIGLPELSIYPIVDPRGLVTPVQDGWSIDFWLLDGRGAMLIPSRLHDESVCQQLRFEDGLSTTTACRQDGLQLRVKASVKLREAEPTVVIDVKATCPPGGSLAVAIRPYNPEGVQFIDEIVARPEHDGWRVNDRLEVLLDRPADRLLASDYANGDVFGWLSDAGGRLPSSKDQEAVRCKVGMATAAVFHLAASQELRVCVPLEKELAALGNQASFNPRVNWPTIRSEVAQLRVPDEQIQFLYDAAVQTLILLSADEIVPGPYTYRRFWFRDACLMMNALLAVGLADRCRRAIERFPGRQMRNGYFRSQEGEWDSNGQVLWILERYMALSGGSLSSEVVASIAPAVSWIDRKRVRDDGDPLHAGLLPAGFSAEHLGPNDHYYWDDFWAEAGLRAAGRIYDRMGRADEAANARGRADDLRRAIDRSVERIPAWRALGGIPASPHRRIDAGAIGSLVADYPLQLYPPASPRIMATVETLMRRCFLRGGFFQDMIHSGVNAYLTLDVAQTLLRAGDRRFRQLVETVAGLASPTGQWPEAIHPHTLGGCMGDGQHGWAAAEWAMMIRNQFVREEGDRLIVGSGLFAEWLESDAEVSFGPTLTPLGAVTVTIRNAVSAPEALIALVPHEAATRLKPGGGVCEADQAAHAAPAGNALSASEASSAQREPAAPSPSRGAGPCGRTGRISVEIPGFELIMRTPVNESIALRRSPASSSNVRAAGRPSLVERAQP
ncbi:MAG: hypothetical protein IT424_01585 [Pirellulales bacterium]|nr:hypothetical protein [Pirellulales bacterium]